MQHLSRDQRAQRILDNGGVHIAKLHLGLWDVDSESRERVYHVGIIRPECQCEDFQKGNRCKHILAAEKASAIYHRPKPQPKRTLEEYIAWATA